MQEKYNEIINADSDRNLLSVSLCIITIGMGYNWMDISCLKYLEENKSVVWFTAKYNLYLVEELYSEVIKGHPHVMWHVCIHDNNKISSSKFHAMNISCTWNKEYVIFFITKRKWHKKY